MTEVLVILVILVYTACGVLLVADYRRRNRAIEDDLRKLREHSQGSER